MVFSSSQATRLHTAPLVQDGTGSGNDREVHSSPPVVSNKNKDSLSKGGSRGSASYNSDQNRDPQGQGAEILRLPKLFSRAAPRYLARPPPSLTFDPPHFMFT